MILKEDCFHLGAKGLIRNEQKKILLLKPSSGGDYWDLPGGRIHRHEPLEEALKREILEETGLHDLLNIAPFAMALTRIRIPTSEGDVGLIFATYLCDIKGDPSIRLSREHSAFEWFDPIKAAELLSLNYPVEITGKVTKLYPS